MPSPGTRIQPSGLGSDIAFLQEVFLVSFQSCTPTLHCPAPVAPPSGQVDHSVITLDCGLLKGKDHAFLISVLLAADVGLLGTVSI